jgi:hypothetical protein
MTKTFFRELDLPAAAGRLDWVGLRAPEKVIRPKKWILSHYA